MIRRFALDSDVLIWHLRGKPRVVEHVTALARKGALLVSAIARAEVLAGMRAGEEGSTLLLLDNLETAPVTAAIADRAADAMRDLRSRGVTVHLADALIAATAVEHDAELHTCNPRHYPHYDLDIIAVTIGD
jgi:predicted nucleic acid-binding protein